MSAIRIIYWTKVRKARSLEVERQRRHMTTSRTTTGRNFLGIGLIVVGVIAMPVPVIPGIPLIAAGVAVLGKDHPIALFLRRQMARWIPTR